VTQKALPVPYQPLLDNEGSVEISQDHLDRELPHQSENKQSWKGKKHVKVRTSIQSDVFYVVCKNRCFFYH
jgi:hypothetical protein